MTNRQATRGKTNQILEALMAGADSIPAIRERTKLTTGDINSHVWSLEKQQRVVADDYSKKRGEQIFRVIRLEPNPRGKFKRIHPTKAAEEAIKESLTLRAQRLVGQINSEGDDSEWCPMSSMCAQLLGVVTRTAISAARAVSTGQSATPAEVPVNEAKTLAHRTPCVRPKPRVGKTCSGHASAARSSDVRPRVPSTARPVRPKTTRVATVFPVGAGPADARTLLAQIARITDWPRCSARTQGADPPDRPDYRPGHRRLRGTGMSMTASGMLTTGSDFAATPEIAFAINAAARDRELGVGVQA